MSPGVERQQQRPEGAQSRLGTEGLALDDKGRAGPSKLWQPSKREGREDV